jgi:hypothetical protein
VCGDNCSTHGRQKAEREREREREKEERRERILEVSYKKPFKGVIVWIKMFPPKGTCPESLVPMQACSEVGL